VVQAVTGLVLAGTDLYKPPFGGLFADWVTDGDPDKLAQLTPGSKKYVDTAAYDEMRNFRSPIATTHLYTFYLLMAATFLHIVGVVVTDVREKNGLISAMFSGEKVLSKAPVDGKPAIPEPRSES
jgi:cytochrome b